VEYIPYFILILYYRTQLATHSVNSSVVTAHFRRNCAHSFTEDIKCFSVVTDESTNV